MLLDVLCAWGCARQVLYQVVACIMKVPLLLSAARQPSPMQHGDAQCSGNVCVTCRPPTGEDASGSGPAQSARTTTARTGLNWAKRNPGAPPLPFCEFLWVVCLGACGVPQVQLMVCLLLVILCTAHPPAASHHSCVVEACNLSWFMLQDMHNMSRFACGPALCTHHTQLWLNT